MNSNELKGNNYIYLTKDKFKTQKIHQLGCFDIYKLSENDCKDIKPIPLTEEILLKCGAKKCSEVPYQYSMFMNNQEYYIDIEHHYVYLQAELDSSFNMVKDFKYLHQLQNLNFALTNKELEVNR